MYITLSRIQLHLFNLYYKIEYFVTCAWLTLLCIKTLLVHNITFVYTFRLHQQDLGWSSSVEYILCSCLCSLLLCCRTSPEILNDQWKEIWYYTIRIYKINCVSYFHWHENNMLLWNPLLEGERGGVAIRTVEIRIIMTFTEVPQRSHRIVGRICCTWPNESS